MYLPEIGVIDLGRITDLAREIRDKYTAQALEFKRRFYGQFEAAPDKKAIEECRPLPLRSPEIDFIAVDEAAAIPEEAFEKCRKRLEGEKE